MTIDYFIHTSGFLASIAITMGYLPQTIRTIRTRSTDDIAGNSFLLMGIGAIFFMVNGFLTHNYYLAVANMLTGTMSAIIYAIKISNDAKKRRGRRKND